MNSRVLDFRYTADDVVEPDFGKMAVVFWDDPSFNIVDAKQIDQHLLESRDYGKIPVKVFNGENIYIFARVFAISGKTNSCFAF